MIQSMVNQFKLLIFDVDGTIANTDMMLIKTYETLYKKYRKDLKEIDVEKIKTFSGPPLKETLMREFPNVEYDLIFKEYKFYSHPNYIKYVTAFPNTRETLLKFKNDGYKLAIATSKMHDATLFTLHLLNLEDIFDVIVGSDDVTNPKPNRETIDKIIKICNVNPSEAVLIGDTKYDIYTAKNAGIVSIIMQFMNREMPSDATPIKYCKTFEELYTFIRGQ
jgi:pyrophosphatase PpaX